MRPKSDGELGQSGPELGFLGDLLANQYCPFGSARSLDDRKFTEMEGKYIAKKAKLKPKHGIPGREAKKSSPKTKDEISNVKGRLLLEGKRPDSMGGARLPNTWLNSKRLRDFNKIIDQPIDQDSFEKIYEWIDMDVTQGGKNLSLPEKKVIMIARALLEQPRILLIDEKALDIQQNQNFYYQSIWTHLQESAIITVLNDYQNLLDFDKVFVMHNGKTIEEGAPLDLLLERPPQVILSSKFLGRNYHQF